MNVKDMVQEINAALDYNPELKQYTDSIVRCINRHYLQVSSQYQWLFMQDKKPLVLRADIESKNYDGTSATISFRKNSCVGRLPSTFSAKILHLPPDVEGQYLVIKNTITDNNGDSHVHQRSYRIVRYINPRCIIVDRPPDSDLALNHGAATYTAQTMTTTSFDTWTIEYRKYPMPREAVEVLSVTDRGLQFSENLRFSKFTSTAMGDEDWVDGEWYHHIFGISSPDASAVAEETVLNSSTAPNDGRFVFLDSRKEENIYLDRSDKGDSFVSVEEMYDNIDPPSAPALIHIPRLSYFDGGFFIDDAGGDDIGSLPLTSSERDEIVEYLERNLSITRKRLKKGDWFTGSVGALVPGFRYEYCCTYEEFGVESAPSPVSSTEIISDRITDSPSFACVVMDCGSTLTLRNEFSGYGDADSDYGFSPGAFKEEKYRKLFNLKSFRDTGRRIKIYRRATPINNETEQGRLHHARSMLVLSQELFGSHFKQCLGKWKHIATTSHAAPFVDMGLDLLISTDYRGVGYLAFREEKGDNLDIPFAYDGDSANNEADTYAMYPVDRMGDPERAMTLDETGPRQYLRFWKTPDSDYKVEVRYHRRPRRLQADQDVPEWPPQYHHYLVYAALKDVCMQHGMTNHSTMYERRAEEILQRMKNKYLSRTDRVHVRRGFDRSMREREIFGVPSKS